MSAGRPAFRARLVPTLFTIVAVLTCSGLGVWQVQRLHWKSGLIAAREAALAAPPIAPPADVEEPHALEFHRVVAEGAFLHDREILKISPGPTGGSGFEVLTPLREASGRIIFVDRGFVPTDRKDPATRVAGQLDGNIRVTGVLRLPPAGKPSWFLPENQPERHFWFWLDLPAMAAADRLGNVAPFYLDADGTPNPGGWPRGGAAIAPLPNDHLQYAITWFLLAAAAAVIYFLSQRSTADAGANEGRPPA